MDEHAGEAEPLLHAAGESADERAFLFAEADELQHVVHRLLALRGRDLVTRAEEVEILGHLHVLVHAEEVGHVADDVAHGVGIAHDVVAEDECLSGGGREEGGEDAERGGLARAVRADEAEEIALVDSEVERVQRDHAAVAAGEAESLNSGKWRS